MHVFIVLTQKLERVPFVAVDWIVARKIAHHFGGTNHRGVTIIPVDHSLHDFYKRQLGL